LLFIIILIVFFQVNGYLSQLAAASGGDKGPSFDPYAYMQASVGAPGIRGIPGKTILFIEKFQKTMNVMSCHIFDIIL
jgi:hypothetical protein